MCVFLLIVLISCWCLIHPPHVPGLLGIIPNVISHCFCCHTVSWVSSYYKTQGNTHKISRLLVPFRSGNSRIWVAPLSELQLKRNNGVSELPTPWFSFPNVCAHLQYLTAHFIPPDSSSKVNTGCFGCIVICHKSRRSAFSYDALS